MHGEHSGDFFDRETAVALRLHSKSHSAGGPFAKDEALGLDGRWLKGHSHGLFFSAYQNRPLSFQSAPDWQTNFFERTRIHLKTYRLAKVCLDILEMPPGEQEGVPARMGLCTWRRPGRRQTSIVDLMNPRVIDIKVTQEPSKPITIRK
jgi:hypothetical protein